MCRIHGFFNSHGSPGEMDAVAALHRRGGPDSTGSAAGPGWALGSNRLAIVDIDGGEQPYRLGEHLTVVFNGEIYNHNELREHLRGLGHRFADRCDGNVLPALYQEYGESFVDHLDGMYAIAVLDRRPGRAVLLLATDDSGMKPLYYRWDPAHRSLHFASEIPALLGFHAVGRSRWDAGLDAYLAGKTPFGEQTMFAEIKVMPPATRMRCVAGEVPVFTRRADPGPEPVTAGLDEVADEVRATMRSEVRRLLHADVPVSVITSGGLDSALVTALAAERQPIHSFTVAYRGTWPFDERRYAAEVARRAGTTHHVVEIDPVDFPALAQTVVAHLGQPNADPITLSSYALFAAVREAGFTVALTGDAADEMFGGYDRMRAATGTAAAGGDWLTGYLDALAVLPAARRRALYTEEYRRRLGDRPGLPREAYEALRGGPGSVLARISEFERRFRLPAYHLRRVDHLSMANSVEARLPFCQPSVVRAARGLPDDLRIRGDQVKRVLYGAGRGLVPPSVLNRAKQPFTLPLTAMLTPGSALWEMTRDVLSPDRLRDGGQLSPAAVEALFAAQAAHPADETALTLWALTVHGMWLDLTVAPRRAASQVGATP
ncbi:asparagine synthase (glutamine-hydrolyzing) [Actinoplanes sp. NPDC051494]|uniref:asparagine synthase (glutamine-hydrolyzing) n=1 Tax=Actinoplanes sp. NPDC051494 TaxID=3363907 RepID=UPI0037B218B1